eukprot:SAG22_NODE_171_length_16646_cov_6.580528_14_plen_768_part_00
MAAVCPDDVLGTRWDYGSGAGDYTVHEEYFVNARGTGKLYGKHLIRSSAQTKSKGSVLCLFGAGDHCNSPYHGGQMLTLAKMGFDVHSFDYESLGRSQPTHASGEPRFFIRDFAELVDDAVLFATGEITKYARREAQLFIFGESMGGAVGLLASRRLATSGAVILAPMCKLGEGMKPGPVMTAVFSVLARVTPKTYLPLGKVEPKKHAGAPEPGYADLSMWEQQERDPLRVQQFPPRLGTALSILHTTLHIQETMEDFGSPLLLLGGADDPVCAPEAVRELHQRARSIDKTLIQYPATGHCIMAEACADEVGRDIQAWLDARVVQPPPPPPSWRDAAVPPPAEVPCSAATMLGCCAVVLLLLAAAQAAVLGPVLLVALLILINAVQVSRAHTCCGDTAAIGLPTVLGLLLVLFDLGVLDPHFFHAGCDTPAGKPGFSSSSSAGEHEGCGITSWREGEYGDVVLFTLELLFVLSLLKSRPFVAALKTGWWDGGEVADKLRLALLLTVVLLVVGGGCNRMRGGWRPYGSLGSGVEHILGGEIDGRRMLFAVPTGLFVMLLSGQPVLALLVAQATLVGSQPGWGCYFQMARDDGTGSTNCVDGVNHVSTEVHGARDGMWDWLLGWQSHTWEILPPTSNSSCTICLHVLAPSTFPTCPSHTAVRHCGFVLANRAWRYAYAGMALRGVVWWLPPGFAMRSSGYGVTVRDRRPVESFYNNSAQCLSRLLRLMSGPSDQTIVTAEDLFVLAGHPGGLRLPTGLRAWRSAAAIGA